MAVINLGLTANSSTPLYDPAYPDGDRSASLSAPANFAAVAGDTVVSLSWNVVATATDYETRIDAGAWVSTSNSLAHQFTGLTNATEYDFDVRAATATEDGPLSSTAATPVAAVGLTLLDSTDFESDMGAATDPFASGYPTRVTSNPHTGSYSLRVNLKNGITDPITTKSGSNLQTANYYPSASITTAATTDSATWEAWFRYDDCNWSGNDSINGKLFYLLGPDASALADTFYLSGSGLGGSNGNINMSQNGFLPNWHNRPYGWDGSSGKSAVLYLSTGVSFGPDGTWHKVVIEIDYINGGVGYSRMRVSIDGTWAGDSRGNCDINGWFNMPPEMVIHGQRLGYGDSSAAGAATDANGEYAAGLQWDDLKLYEGVE